MLGWLIYFPTLVFAGYFWLRLGKWAYLHGRQTYHKVVAMYGRLLKLKDEAFDLYRKQG